MPMQYTEIFLALKIEKFQLKNFDTMIIVTLVRIFGPWPSSGKQKSNSPTK